ncbi:proteasomal ubiquitin receptor ADRM1 homolog [Agrilus planipennis]|uniref:Proteasomal ubiquitin receptor ADRM1 homolog n=1 Tax=Agrilus planipennis TaxID=224129 RepID=A0A7F5QXR8_AGRPL|nr:proteasomal ubiquitin receptor ADRM1 homolog [Agrilus planipennis]
MIYPDKRKGLLYIYQSDDSLMHFCWQDRSTGFVEDDLIIFPDDCEYVRVPQCTTGRAYLLKFKSSSRRFFFWLQEPRTDKDDENCKYINELLNNPSSSVQNSGMRDQNLQSLLNNMSQSQLMQLFGGGQIGSLSSLLGTMNRPSPASRNSTPAITHRSTPASATTPSNPPAVPDTNSTSQITSSATEASKKNDNPIQLSDLQNFLQGIASPGSEQQQQNQTVDLSTALNSESLSGILSSSEAIQQLQSHLPDVGGNSAEQLRSTLSSPQFQQAVQQFSSALESGQLGPVVSQLSVSQEAVAAASEGNMAEFVKALENSVANDATQDKDKSKKEDGNEDKKDDEGMQLD